MASALRGARLSDRAKMRPLRYGWSRTRSNSAAVSVPGLSQTAFETPTRPRRCTNPARRTSVWSSAGNPWPRAAAAASSATPRECPMVYGDLTSTKSAIASKAASNSEPDSHAPNPGSSAITAPQVVTASNSANTSEAARQNTSTMAGSNCVPLRSRATETAASVPPIRWNTSTTSARLTMRAVVRIWSPFAPAGAPLSSHRSKVSNTRGATRAAPHPPPQPESTSKLVGGVTVALQCGASSRPAGSEQLDTKLRAITQRQPRAKMFHHEPACGKRVGEIHVAVVGLQRKVVAEPLRLLIRVDVTANPSKQRRVVHDAAIVAV